MPPNHLPELEKKMSELRDSIAEYADKFPRIFSNVNPYLKEKRFSGNYLEYIIFGTALIESILYRFFDVLAHSHSYDSFVKEIESTGTVSDSADVKMVSRKDEDPFGALVRKLVNDFNIDQTYPNLYKKLTTLKIKRNAIAHDFIDEYEGDFDKANNDFKSYADGQPIELLINEIAKISDDIRNKQDSFFKEKFKK